MENIVFERDYSTKSEKCADKSLEPDIFDYAIESGLFKSYRDAMRKKQKYIVPKEKEAYDSRSLRLATPKTLHCYPTSPQKHIMLHFMLPKTAA